MIDAVIVGAGPAGSTVGKLIASAGFEVLILEKSNFSGFKKMCGGAISQSCFNDLNLPEKIIEKEGFNIVLNLPSVKKKLCGSGFVVVKREIFDKLLVQKAVDNTATLLNSTIVINVVKTGNGMKVSYKKCKENKIEDVHTRLVVFADGTNTLAYSKFNLGFKEDPDYTALALAYELKCKSNKFNSLDFFISEKISPFGYGWIFPKRDSINIGILCLLSKIHKNLNNYLDTFIVSQKLNKLKKISFGARLIPLGIPKNLVGDSALVVGDAAGTADPITGSGISNAIENSKEAAKIAIKALKAKNTSNDFLVQYAQNWEKNSVFIKIQKSLQLHKLALEKNVIPGLILYELGFFNW